MRLNSLAFRLFATAAAWTLFVLPLAGVLIFSLYRNDVEASFDSRLRVLLTVIVADSIDHGGATPGNPRDVGEPLFEITHSGWYWQIKPIGDTQGTTRVSSSLASESLRFPSDLGAGADGKGVRWANASGPLGERLRIAEMHYAVGDEGGAQRYAFAVAGTLAEVERSLSSFRTRLIIALALTGLGFVAVTLFQVRFGLLPLRAIGRGLAAIRSGDAMQLDGELPSEIEPLQAELNALIKSNQDIVDRARTQVGNLAHALKTPLAVITNEARDSKGTFASKVAEQAQLMRDQINHYLDRARVAARAGVGRATVIEPVLGALVRTLGRIYRDKGVGITLDCPNSIRFQGEKQDFEEMLGNLLDNACKWSRTSVHVSVIERALVQKSAARRLVVTVEEDGPGLSAEQIQRIGKRGIRLDETKPGSGLGLSIVTDLAQSYGGKLELMHSERGGLKAVLELPAV